MAHVCILFRTLIPCLETGYKCLPQDNGGMTWNRHAISVGVQSRKQKPLQPERLKTENYVLTKVSGGLKESAGGWALRITPKDKKLAHQGCTQECGASGVSPPERSIRGELQTHTFPGQSDIFHCQGEAPANDFPNTAPLSGLCSLLGAQLLGRWRATVKTE